MKLNKAQVRTILVLDLVLIVLILAIGAQFLLGGRSAVPVDESSLPANADNATATDEKPSEPEYSRSRAARKSTAAALELETNIGGSGDESLVDVIATNGRVFVFGNTTSTDCDADGGSGAFVAELDETLTTLDFYRPSERKIVGVTLAEGGFLLALGGENGVSLALMGYDGKVTATAPETDGEFAALRLTDDGYALVTSVTHSPLVKKKLFLRAFDFSLNRVYERMIFSPYSLEFVDLFKVGKTYAVFFNAVSDLSRHAGAATCDERPEPVLAYIDKGGAYRASAVAPVSGGWAIAAIYEGGDGALMIVGDDFSKKTVIFQGATLPLSATIGYCDNTYYVGFFGGEASVALAYDSGFKVQRRLNALGSLSGVTDFISGGDWGLFAGTTGDALGVVGSRGSCSLRFGSGNESNPRLACSDDDFYVAACSKGTSADVGGSFGGTDLWIAKLKIGA